MNNRINDSNIAIGISMTNTIRPPTSLSVQNSNTYDINANIMIGIDDTIQLGGLSIPTDDNYNLPPGTGTGSGTDLGTGSKNEKKEKNVVIKNEKNDKNDKTENLKSEKNLTLNLNLNDPYGVGLTEKELSYVTPDNKLILFEVSEMFILFY